MRIVKKDYEKYMILGGNHEKTMRNTAFSFHFS